MESGIPYECPQCGKQLILPADYATRRLRCPGCKSPIEVDEPKDEPISLEGNDPILSPSGLGLAGRDSPFWHLRWALPLMFVPLVLMTFKRDDTEARFERTVEQNQDRIVRFLMEHPEAKGDPAAIIQVLPGEKIVGAYLPQSTKMHWVFAAVAGLLWGLVFCVVYPLGQTTPLRVLSVGLFTGTIGIVLLLVFQFLAEVAASSRVTVGGKAGILLLLAKLIGFSYSAAENPENGFWLSFFGFTIGVGLCEEACKALPVLVHFKNTGKLDWRGACAWGLASGVGFGVCEGILYSGRSYNGISGPDIYLVRFLSCVALHAVWSATAAILIWRRRGKVKHLDGIGELALAAVPAILPVMVLHGLYDTLLKQDYHALALGAGLVSVALFMTLFELQRVKDLRLRTAS